MIPRHHADADPYGALGGLDDLALEGPLFWPGIPADDACSEPAELRAWVHRLVARYDLDSHVVPGCWYRHNHLVEALAALRDHERGSFAVTAPATAAVEWQRAWRDIESRLRAWIAELRCDTCHHPDHDTQRVISDDDWNDWAYNHRVSRRGLTPVQPGRPNTQAPPRCNTGQLKTRLRRPTVSAASLASNRRTGVIR